MSIFRGAGVALITPFKEDESVDYNQLHKLIDYQIENETDSIIICGTTGESATMSKDERIEVIRDCVNYVNGRIPVIAGSGTNCTRDAIYLTKEATKCGVDGLLVVTPYYNKATQTGLIDYYTKIAKSTDKPILMYNVPSRTGCNIAPSTVAKLVKEADNIVGIKEASGDISQIANIMDATNGEIDLYSGNDDQIVPIMSLGGIGVISVLSNVVPKETHLITQYALDGDFKEATKLQLKYLELVHNLFSEVNPIPIKRAMKELGYCNGCVRSPMTEMNEEKAKIMLDTMKTLNII